MFRYFITYLGLAALIASLIIPSVLNYGLYTWQSQKLKKEVKTIFKAGLEQSQISSFEFEAVQYQSLEREGKSEFFWEGHKYDLISLDFKKGKVLIKAWLDDKESSLNRQFHNLLKRHQPSSENNDQPLIDYFKGFYFQSITLAYKSFPQSHFGSDVFDASLDPVLKIVSPPPRL